jgi:hypothetical protein
VNKFCSANKRSRNRAATLRSSTVLNESERLFPMHARLTSFSVDSFSWIGSWWW